MYESHFGLMKRPFAVTPDGSCVFITEAILETLSELQLRLDAGQGIAILTAGPGTGKTLLCRHLAAQLQEKFSVILLGSANFPSHRALLQSLLYELGAAYTGLDEHELRLELQSQLQQRARAGRPAVLILDEAHLLPTNLLDEIRTLADLTADGQPLLRMMLSGQLLLEERLISAELDAINQRLVCHVYLDPLTLEESRNYVRYRITVAGGDADQIFTTEALDLIVHSSSGLPRCLNQLCDHSLLLAFVADYRDVPRAIVSEALQDLRQLPLHWNESVSPAAPSEGNQFAVYIPAEEQTAASSLLNTPPAEPPEPAAFSIEIGAVEGGTEPEAYRLAFPLSPSATTAYPTSQSDSAPPSSTRAELPTEVIPLSGIRRSPSIDVSHEPVAAIAEQFAETLSRDPGPRPTITRVEQTPTAPTADSGWIRVDSRALPLPASATSTPFGLWLDRAVSGVVPLLDKHQTPLRELVEEYVVDRYAAIDAASRRPQRSSVLQPQFNPLAGAATRAADLPAVPAAPPAASAVNRPEDYSLRQPAPDELLEQILPLIEAAMAPELPPGLGEWPSSGAREPAQPQLPVESVAAEDHLGAEVLDICLDVQDELTRPIQDQAAAASQNVESEDEEDSSSFDVIEPEAESDSRYESGHFIIDRKHTIDNEERPSGTGPLIPRPNYRRVFSLLRRKLGR